MLRISQTAGLLLRRRLSPAGPFPRHHTGVARTPCRASHTNHAPPRSPQHQLQLTAESDHEIMQSIFIVSNTFAAGVVWTAYLVEKYTRPNQMNFITMQDFANYLAVGLFGGAFQGCASFACSLVTVHPVAWVCLLVIPFLPSATVSTLNAIIKIRTKNADRNPPTPARVADDACSWGELARRARENSW